MRTSSHIWKFKVFGHRVLRRVFGCKRGEVIGGWRKLHNGESQNSYSVPDIIGMIKSRRIK
jgi:hypothetical protein